MSGTETIVGREGWMVEQVPVGAVTREGWPQLGDGGTSCIEGFGGLR